MERYLISQLLICSDQRIMNGEYAYTTNRWQDKHQYCIVLYYIVLYCIVLHCIALQYVTLQYILLYYFYFFNIKISLDVVLEIVMLGQKIFVQFTLTIILFHVFHAT